MSRAVRDVQKHPHSLMQTRRHLAAAGRHPFAKTSFPRFGAFLFVCDSLGVSISPNAWYGKAQIP